MEKQQCLEITTRRDTMILSVKEPRGLRAALELLESDIDCAIADKAAGREWTVRLTEWTQEKLDELEEMERLG